MIKTYKTLLLGFGLLLGGCAVPDVDVPLVSYKTSLDLDLTASGTQTPIPVHYFALTSDEKFKKLDYFELMKLKESTLSGSIVSQSKMTLLPNKKDVQEMEIPDTVRFFAVVAGFKDVTSNDNWRFIQKLEQGSGNDLTLKIHSDHIEKIND